MQTDRHGRSEIITRKYTLRQAVHPGRRASNVKSLAPLEYPPYNAHTLSRNL
jgi:hypothetical protein